MEVLATVRRDQPDDGHRARVRPRRRRVAGTLGAALLAAAMTVTVSGPALAATGSLYASGLTDPVLSSSVLRYDTATGVEDLYATGTPAGTAFKSVTALGSDSSGGLFVGDDPTEGAQVLQGHVYQVPFVP